MRDAPKGIHYDRAASLLSLDWGNSHAQLSAEFLRVHSPSAEVRGHGVGQETLQVGKKFVAITGIEPAGNYAIKIIYDDGHDSGLYDWDYLYKLGQQQEALWQEYLNKLENAGASREPSFIPVKQV